MSSSTLIQDSSNLIESHQDSSASSAYCSSSFTSGCVPVSKPSMQCSLSSSSSLYGNSSPGLSSSSSSLSSNASTISLNSNSTISNDLTVHFMLYNSINVISKRYAGTDIYFKIASFDMNEIMEGSHGTVDEENMEIGDEYPVEIAVMNNLEHKFHPQEQFGRLLQNNEFIILRSRMPMTEHIGIRVDLFKKVNENGDEKFVKVAFGYVYPLDINESSGFCIMPITSDTGKIVAKIKAEYFFTRSYRGFLNDDFIIKFKTRNPKSWQLKKNGFDIGHRGAGSARRVDRNEKILENTVDSFNYAFKQGADMVELDVQLSKDKIPIVYHDFNVNIILQKKDRDIESFEVNIKDLTFSQLQKLKLNPVLHGKETYDFDEEDTKPYNQPFASFRTVLESVVADCGFNVEIKYPQKKINGQWESQKSHDLNEYVDLILQDLFSYAGDRNIIISSFHPEICSLVKLKQDRYPVLFLTQGLTTKWTQYANPLNHSINMAVYLALCMGLYGVAVHAEDIIKDRSLIHFVKSKMLILFCWGDDLNDRELIKNLKKEGVDGAIYDKIDLLVAKEDQIQNEHQAIQLRQ